MKIYVGTYQKYNSGSISGAWIDITNFSNKEEFLEECKKLHKDEEEPEFMFQDFEEIPENFISECSVSENLWKYIELIEEHGEKDSEAFIEWLDNQHFNFDKDDFCDLWDNFKDDYLGFFDSEQEFCEHIFEEFYAYMISDIFRNYIDEVSFINSNWSFYSRNGHYFNN
jgi:antirestriction protein